jgi:hypothetical protein
MCRFLTRRAATFRVVSTGSAKRRVSQAAVGRIAAKRCQGACKPGSVPPTVSQMGPYRRWQPFIWAARCRARSSNQPGSLGAKHPCLTFAKRETPIWSCSGWGLPCGRCYQNPGALLPHPFTLACEVALHRRFALCGTFPERKPESLRPAGVTRHPCFVEPGLSSQGLPPTRLPGPLAVVDIGGEAAFYQPPRQGRTYWPFSSANR